MSKYIPYSIAILALSSLQAFATITIQIQADILQNSDGTPTSKNAAFMLLVDTLGNGFQTIRGGQDTAPGSATTPGGDDYVVFSGRIGTNTDTDGFIFDTAAGLDSSLVPGAQWTQGDPIALIWLPVNLPTATKFVDNSPYGLFTSTQPVNGGGAWLTPSFVSGDVTLALVTPDSSVFPNGTTPPAAARATNNVAPVPEPTTIGLLGLGVAGLVARRRRK